MIFIMKTTLENSEIDGKRVVKEFKDIKNFQPSANFALETINKNKDLVYDKKYVIKFLETYQEYLKLKKQYKKLVENVSKEYKKEKQKLKHEHKLQSMQEFDNDEGKTF